MDICNTVCVQREKAWRRWFQEAQASVFPKRAPLAPPPLRTPAPVPLDKAGLGWCCSMSACRYSCGVLGPPHMCDAQPGVKTCSTYNPDSSMTLRGTTTSTLLSLSFETCTHLPTLPSNIFSCHSLHPSIWRPPLQLFLHP